MLRLIYEEFQKLPSHLYTTLKQKYVEKLSNFNQIMDGVLKNGFGMPSYKFLREIETSLNAYCREQLTFLFVTQAR
jgi:hypothetical protein